MYNAGRTLPSSKELAKEAKSFIHGNKEWVILYAKSILPYVFAVELVHAILAPHSKWAVLIQLISSFLYACFAMSWHRAVIWGPRGDYIVNPLRLTKEDKPFFMAFLLIAVLPVIAGGLGGVLLGIAKLLGNPIIGTVLLAVALGVMFAGVYKVMQYSFMLPARSVGINLSRGEAVEMSKGLIGRFFMASLRVGILPVLGLMILAVIVGAVCGIAFKMEPNVPNIPGETTGGLLLLIPVLILNFYLISLGVTVLSFLYQWSTQNRLMIAPKSGDQEGTVQG